MGEKLRDKIVFLMVHSTTQYFIPLKLMADVLVCVLMEQKQPGNLE